MTSSEQIQYLCHGFGRIHRAMMHGIRRAPELRPSEAGALWMIVRAGEGGVNPSEVSRKMSMARPSLTPILRELEDKALICRIPDPLDGRRCLLVATEEVRARHRAVMQEHTELMTRMLSSLSEEEVLMLCKILHKIELALPDRYEGRSQEEELG